jgi:hypothetical protein
MNDDTTKHRDVDRRHGKQGVLAVVVVGIALLTTACSTGSPDTSAASAATSQQKALAYAECMRSHGITAFPDPNSQGTFTYTGRLNASSPQYQQANQGCEKLLPDGGHVTSGESQILESQGLRYAACMRSHGIANFPDPMVMSNGAVSLAAPGIDPNSPKYQTANQACEGDLHVTSGDG